MKSRITERTVVAGIDVVIKDQAKVEAAYKRLGGKVLEVSDKGMDLEFPSRVALDEFMQIAKAQGAIFERYEER